MSQQKPRPFAIRKMSTEGLAVLKRQVCKGCQVNQGEKVTFQKGFVMVQGRATEGKRG